jgi:nucleotide-binding universal stress UspA family protein
MAQVAASSGISTSTDSIADPISAAAGLEQHLEQHPASLVVLGGGQKSALRGTGTVRALLRGAEVPLLVVNRSKMELEADPGGE